MEHTHIHLWIGTSNYPAIRVYTHYEYICTCIFFSYLLLNTDGRKILWCIGYIAYGRITSSGYLAEWAGIELRLDSRNNNTLGAVSWWVWVLSPPIPPSRLLIWYCATLLVTYTKILSLYVWNSLPLIADVNNNTSLLFVVWVTRTSAYWSKFGVEILAMKRDTNQV